MMDPTRSASTANTPAGDVWDSVAGGAPHGAPARRGGGPRREDDHAALHVGMNRAVVRECPGGAERVAERRTGIDVGRSQLRSAVRRDGMGRVRTVRPGHLLADIDEYPRRAERIPIVRFGDPDARVCGQYG